jgi:uncharacterized cupredoxin-like copper-binding protein/Cu/Ag efflux protein CusF
MKYTIVGPLAIALLLFSTPALVRADESHDSQHSAQASDLMHHGRGVIESVDASKGVVTMEHEPIQSLRWPKMVMTFKVHDAALLNGLKEGDQVDFDLAKMGKEYHIIRIEAARADGTAARRHDHTSHQHGAHGHRSAAGKPGKASAAKRTIEVTMHDTMRYEPASITVKAGETVRFVVRNKGQLSHEFGIGTLEEQAKHAEMMKAMPDMKHDDPNVITVEPGQKKELIWQFTRAGTFEIACHVPGHYPAGMKMAVKSVK